MVRLSRPSLFWFSLAAAIAVVLLGTSIPAIAGDGV